MEVYWVLSEGNVIWREFKVWRSYSNCVEPKASWSYKPHHTTYVICFPYLWCQIIAVYKVRHQLAVCMWKSVWRRLVWGLNPLEHLKTRYCWGSFTPSDSLQAKESWLVEKRFLEREREACVLVCLTVSKFILETEGLWWEFRSCPFISKLSFFPRLT